ncbi:uncharacterized protein LOC115693262 [Syzygium oleosum]|uniref:uncharacterized protein LOC115693262 n=1 Tax=Syzygium oleosum TaxID=219896 RepID=UPI0011D1EBEA|nr:uncharacterized protein LOC115693262 [Syzygium oleosum]
MSCFVPFNRRNLDICFFVFRPTLVVVDELVEALKRFSVSTEALGCVQSSIFRSIHGNMIIWYGAWMRKSSDNKESLNATLLSMLTDVSTMAILIEHSFFEPYAGESRDGSLAAKLSTGDIISVDAAESTACKIGDLAYACLAIFKSRFMKIEGVNAGVCMKSQSQPRVACIVVWKSLQFCYSYILKSEYRKAMLPYLERFSLDIKYDIFKVVYVSSEGSVSYHHHVSPQPMLGHEGESKERQVMQN